MRVTQEIKTSDGVRAIFDRGGDRAKNFSSYLFQKLQEISASSDIPLVISGMASSTIGWMELPYARVPFTLDGAGLRVEAINWEAGGAHLVSGVATEKEIMRGEETQAIGILAAPDLAQYRERCRLILPGTHSKHLFIRENQVIDFKTYLTGELFEVLSKNSILRATVASDAAHDPNSFAEGVAEAKNNDLLGTLFQARTRGVLGGASSEANTSFLSGLLIGSELASIAHEADEPVLLAATEPLAKVYSAALKILGLSSVFASETLEQATIRAHALILQKQLK